MSLAQVHILAFRGGFSLSFTFTTNDSVLTKPKAISTECIIVAVAELSLGVLHAFIEALFGCARESEASDTKTSEVPQHDYTPARNHCEINSENITSCT